MKKTMKKDGKEITSTFQKNFKKLSPNNVCCIEITHNWQAHCTYPAENIPYSIY